MTSSPPTLSIATFFAAVQLFGYLCMLIGLVIAVRAAWRLYRGVMTLWWPSTEGLIVGSDLHSGHTRGFDGPRFVYYPLVTYEYQVNGNSYTSQTVALSRQGSRVRFWATNILETYPTGSRVYVYYHPRTPQKAYLEPGPNWHDGFKFCVGIIFLWLGYRLATVFGLPLQLPDVSAIGQFLYTIGQSFRRLLAP